MKEKEEEERRVCRDCNCILFTSSDDCPNCGIIFVPRRKNLNCVEMHVAAQQWMVYREERYKEMQPIVFKTHYFAQGVCGEVSLVEPTVPLARKSDVEDQCELLCELEEIECIKQCDGVVDLIIFGDEVVVVEKDGSLLSADVKEGAWETVNRLAYNVCGHEAHGMKKMGELFLDGVIHFVYVMPQKTTLFYGGARLVTLNQALMGGNTESLKAVMKVYPLLGRLHLHYPQMIDDDAIADLRYEIAKGKYRPISVMNALVASYPVKLNFLREWMELLGFKLTRKSYKKMFENPSFMLFIDDNGMVALDVAVMQYYAFRAEALEVSQKRKKVSASSLKVGWDCHNYGRYVLGEEYTVPLRNDDPYPKPQLVELLKRHPLVQIAPGKEGVRWMQLEPFSELSHACGHGDRCRRKCVGSEKDEEDDKLECARGDNRMAFSYELWDRPLTSDEIIDDDIDYNYRQNWYEDEFGDPTEDW